MRTRPVTDDDPASDADMLNFLEAYHLWIVNEDDLGEWLWQVWGKIPQPYGPPISKLYGEAHSMRAAIEVAMKGILL